MLRQRHATFGFCNYKLNFLNRIVDLVAAINDST
jgi:hypothetical protein